MADRFSTPPRNTRSAAPCSPAANPGDAIVFFDGALSGNYLMAKKVTATTTLFDVRAALVAALGGQNRLNEVHLIDAQGELHDKAFCQPFSQASSGERYGALLVPMDDMVYLDMADRKVSAMAKHVI